MRQGISRQAKKHHGGPTQSLENELGTVRHGQVVAQHGTNGGTHHTGEGKNGEQALAGIRCAMNHEQKAETDQA